MSCWIQWAKDSSVSTYYSVIFVLSDLRDQAGRVASNIIAAVTFGEKIPEENLANSLTKPASSLLFMGLGAYHFA